MNRIAAAVLITLCLGGLSPALAEGPCTTVRKQRRAILVQHFQQVRPVHRQMGQETGLFLNEVGTIMQPQIVLLVLLWPQIQPHLEAALQQAQAAFKALPPGQQTIQAAIDLLVRGLTPVFQGIVDLLGPTVTVGQLTALDRAVQAYSANMAALAQQLQLIAADTRAKLAALPPCR